VGGTEQKVKDAWLLKRERRVRGRVGTMVASLFFCGRSLFFFVFCQRCRVVWSDVRPRARSVLGAMNRSYTVSLVAADAPVRSFRVIREKNFKREKQNGRNETRARSSRRGGGPVGALRARTRNFGEVVSVFNRLRRRRAGGDSSRLPPRKENAPLVRAFLIASSSSPRPARARSSSESAARVASGDALARGVVEI
jgi:hypothetical protein